MLRNYIGDDAFFHALNLYLEKHKFSAVEVHDLRLAFEEVTGEDLNWFFNQWFLASGHPVLKVRDTYQDNVLSVEVSQLQDKNTTPVYRLPLYIDVWAGNVEHRFHVIIDKPTQTFEFDIDVEPSLVLFDGDQQLLAEIDHPKSIEYFEYQFYNTDKFLPRYYALDTLLKITGNGVGQRVLKDALTDDFWHFRQMAVNALEDFDLQFRDEVEERLVQMAQSDEKSLVRADALHSLFSSYENKYTELYKKALGDSSYMVAGTAIYALTAVAPEEMKNYASRFEQYNNVNIVIPLASFYIDNEGHDHYDWFVSKIENAQSETLWYLLQYFGEYIMNASEAVQRKGISILEKHARNSQKDFVRLSAYQSLGLFTDLSGVEEIRKGIRENEKDSYLRQIFESLP